MHLSRSLNTDQIFCNTNTSHLATLKKKKKNYLESILTTFSQASTCCYTSEPKTFPGEPGYIKLSGCIGSAPWVALECPCRQYLKRKFFHHISRLLLIYIYIFYLHVIFLIFIRPICTYFSQQVGSHMYHSSYTYCCILLLNYSKNRSKLFPIHV